MTKEEKIKEAWGEYYNKGVGIDENGWLKESYLNKDNIKTITSMLDIETCIKAYKDVYDIRIPINHYRPKSLKGLENNNGWQKTEEGLPKVSGMYICYHKQGYQSQRYFKAELEEFYEYDSETLNQSDVTHYRPVEILPGPLY